jgi:hypothetical protein
MEPGEFIPVLTTAEHLSMYCHRLQPKLFINTSSYTQARETKLAQLDKPDELGTSCPRDCCVERLTA